MTSMRAGCSSPSRVPRHPSCGFRRGPASGTCRRRSLRSAAATVSGFAPVGDVQLYHEVQGAGEPILFLHGGGGSIAGSWPSDYVTAALPRFSGHSRGQPRSRQDGGWNRSDHLRTTHVRRRAPAGSPRYRPGPRRRPQHGRDHRAALARRLSRPRPNRHLAGGRLSRRQLSTRGVRGHETGA